MGLSNGWSAFLITTPFAGAALFGLVSLQPGVYNALVREDSVECLQFIAYAASTALAAATAWRLERTGHRGLGELFLFACCCLFAAGEEISWGQRVLGFGTPDELAAVNGQEEMNMHDTAFFPHAGHELAKFSEWLETTFALALAVFALLAWRRVGAWK